MRINRIRTSHLMVVALMAVLAGVSHADQKSADAGKSLKRVGECIPLTAEQLKHFEKHTVRVGRVRLNPIGLERVNAHRRSKGLPPLTQDDLELVPVGGEIVPASSSQTLKAASATVRTLDGEGLELPSYVDNSTLPY
ncbi:MAG TPA: hypothetical protein PLP01_17245, partial [Phycisphaerae bacterium]|nr:hypothetical protein [Phycisphaerae bacterium]